MGSRGSRTSAAQRALPEDLHPMSIDIIEAVAARLRAELLLFSKIAKLVMMKSSAKVFRALADPTRRQILQELKHGPLPAGEIAGRFSVSAPTISRHLSILEAAGLVSYRRAANRLIYEAEPESLASTLNGFLSAVCPTQILERKRRKK